MKPLAFILAFLVLGLSFVPCMDDIANMSCSKGKIEVIKLHNQDKSSHEEACSPFCQCACCSGFSVNHNPNTIASFEFFGSRSFASYFPENTIAVSISIWQPPKIS